MTADLHLLRNAFRPRYELEKLLGRGGSADVFLATDVRHARRVALKVLRNEEGTGLGGERFLREIEIAAGLQHPNILPVFDSGDAAGVLFYVMPYVEGDSLRKRLRTDGPFRWADAFTLVRQVGDALAHAHRRGIVHRDIKPDNIMTVSGHAVVADFGIARALADARRDYTTPDGLGLGTPEYMSPEQAFGDVIDARSDIFSLAATVYELLSGSPPFVARDAIAMLMQKSRAPLPELRARDSDVPAHVHGVLSRAMAPDVAERYESVEEFVEALAGGTGPVEAAAARRRLRALAVLPFANRSPDPDDEYLSDGISEEIIYSLARRPELRVVGRTSSFRFKGASIDVRQVAEQLQVGGVVEGSVRRVGDHLRVTAQLVDAATGFERWTERYERRMTDAFAVQDEIARAISAALELAVLQDEPSAQPVPTAPAFQSYLRGRFLWNQRTDASLVACIAALRNAVQLDPMFTSAHAALAEAYVTLAIYGVMSPAEAMRDARAAVEQAFARPSAPAEAFSARACIAALHDWNWNAAEVDFRRAIVANPAYPTAHQWYAMHVLVPQRRFTEAREQLARAREADPLSPVVSLSEGLTHFYERDNLKARVVLVALAAREPQFGLASMFLAQVHSAVGDHPGALAALSTAERLLGATPELVSARGVALARSGDTEGSEQAVAWLADRATTRFVSPVLVGQVLAALGRTDDALAALARAVQERAADLVWVGVRPVFEPLRRDARFQALLRTLRLEV